MLGKQSNQPYSQATNPDPDTEHEARCHGGVLVQNFLGRHHRDRE